MVLLGDWCAASSAIGGYWLVWDQFAQYIARSSTEWLERLPNISDSLVVLFDATASDCCSR